MARKMMFNILELAYNPLCNYDFAIIKEDELFRKFTKDSTIYIIAQRSELTFEGLTQRFEPPHQTILQFEIRQKGNPSVLTCEVPVYQPNLASNIEQEIEFHFQYALPIPDPMPQSFPQHNIRNLLLFYHNKTFISWLSPENFIQNYLNGAMEATVTGPIEDFIKYKVHYVGKATEQEVWKRLTGHSTLQEILSVEFPLHFGTLPTHEIAILFLKLKDAIGLHTIGPGDEITQDVINTLKGTNVPPEKTISLDFEKALINAMQPKYNKEFYKNYPKSKDGLSNYELDAYSFQIQSHIILEYDNGFIKGKPDFNPDAIVVKKGLPLRIINN